MEFPRRDVILGRALALVLMTGVCAVAWHERVNPLPREFALALNDTAYHVRYDPEQRRMDLGYGMPPPGLPSIYIREGHIYGEDPALAGKEWLVNRPLRIPRTRLELELLRLKPDDIRPYHLPWVEPPAPREPIIVEVLNGSGRTGAASAAKNVLRLRGADVVSTGNSDIIETRTIVYDRIGRHENAQAVRDWLGCVAAAAVTKPDPTATVDVTVVVADDCPLQ